MKNSSHQQDYVSSSRRKTALHLNSIRAGPIMFKSTKSCFFLLFFFLKEETFGLVRVRSMMTIVIILIPFSPIRMILAFLKNIENFSVRSEPNVFWKTSPDGLMQLRSLKHKLTQVINVVELIAVVHKVFFCVVA